MTDLRKSSVCRGSFTRIRQDELYSHQKNYHRQPLNPHKTMHNPATINNHQRLWHPFTTTSNQVQQFTSIHNQKQAKGPSQVLWPPSCTEKVCKVWTSVVVFTSAIRTTELLPKTSMCLQELLVVNRGRGGRSKYHENRWVSEARSTLFCIGTPHFCHFH